MPGLARLALALLCSPVLAQQTWVVDPNGGGDFTDLQVAFNTVSAGDTVLVRDGNYPGVVTLDKPLTVIGDSTAGVDIWWLRVGPLTTPGHVVIASLNVGAALALDAPVSLDAVDSAYVWTQNHPVLMRECRFGPNNQSAPGLHVASGDVVVQNCVLRGAPSTVWITRGCNVSGSHPALRVQGGTVTVANSNLAGIRSASLYCPHYPVYGYPSAAAVVTGGALMITNSTLSGGLAGASRVDAVTGPFSGDLSTVTNPPSTTMTPVFLPATRGDSASPGAAITCRIMTQPALPAILVTSLGTRAPVASPFGAAWVDPGFYAILRWGTTDGSGAMDAAIQIPNWVPRGLPFTIQGLAIDPATNGLVLGSPAVAHVL